LVFDTPSLGAGREGRSTGSPRFDTNGLVTGAGEALALVLRVVFGTWADRSGRYWMG
jgi:hypothetical protein